jgi:hypothetical protein
MKFLLWIFDVFLFDAFCKLGHVSQIISIVCLMLWVVTGQKVGKVNAHARCKRKPPTSNQTPILQKQNVPTLAPTSESWTM